MKKLFILILTTIFFTGCNNISYNNLDNQDNSTYDKAIEQGRISLASGELDKALGLFELALEEKPGDKEAKTLHESLVSYNEVKEAIENSNWDQALLDANNLLKYGEIPNTIEVKLKEYIKIAEDNKQQIDEIEVRGNTNTQVNTIPSKKAQYIQKLDNIEIGLSDLNYLYVNAVDSEMTEGEAEAYKRWDDVLNEIWGVLKNQMPKGEMEELRKVQLKWIKYRDATAEQNAAQFGEGASAGTGANLARTGTLAQVTKERCYELVEVYMK